MRLDRENQNRLMKELERLSEDYHAFTPNNNLSPSPLRQTSFQPPFQSPLSYCSDDTQRNLTDISLQFQLETPHSQLSYQPNSDCDPLLHHPVQVDHNGTKVSQLSACSAYVPFFTFQPTLNSGSISSSSSSSSVDKHTLSPSPSAAYLSNLLVKDEPVLKRPRSASPTNPLSPMEVDSYTDTHLSIDDPDDPASPRSISAFAKQGSQAAKTLAKRKEFAKHISTLSMPGTNPIQPSAPTVKSQAVPIEEQRKLLITVSLDAPRDAATCKKRRAEAMERFRRKKAVRCYGRKVRYQIRKRIATSRPRVNGRFARRCDAESQEALKKKNG